jgi:hypothetical protein
VPAAALSALKLTGALAWALAYLLIIRRGFKDRRLGIPWLAVSANVAIELAYAVPLRTTTPPSYALVYGIWLMLDAVIVFQALAYRRVVDPPVVPARWLPAALAVATGAAFALVLLIAAALDDRDGRYSAFLVNVLMSALFLTMLRAPGDVRGQSIYVAWAKLVGTASFAVMVNATGFSPVIAAAGAICLVLDALYVARLGARLRQAGIRPWQRW